MSRIIVYKEENIKQAIKLIDSLHISEISNFKSISELIKIIESGTSGDYLEPKEGDGKNAVEHKKIQSD